MDKYTYCHVTHMLRFAMHVRLLFVVYAWRIIMKKERGGVVVTSNKQIKV